METRDPQGVLEGSSSPLVPSSKSNNGDFIVLTEFNEVIGPEVYYLWGNPPREFDLNSFALECIKGDYRRRRPQGCVPQPNSLDLQLIWTYQSHYVFSQTFAIPDLFGRGYVRTASFAYVTRVPGKQTMILKTLRRVFTKTALELKRAGQKLFLRKIDSCLVWLEYQLSKTREANSEPSAQIKKYGRHVIGFEHKDGIDLQMWRKYFDIELDDKTLKEIKEDMLVIRDVFKKPIREPKSAGSPARPTMIRQNGNRTHHRPQCSKRVFHSLMKVLAESSIERMKLWMEQMLSRCQGSALDIAIEKKLKKKAKSNDMMFNIGSLCKIPVGISKHTPPRKKYLSRHQSIVKQQSPKNNPASYSKVSYIVSSSESESIDDLDHQEQNQSSEKNSTLQLLISPLESNSSCWEKKSSSMNNSNELLASSHDNEQLSLDSGIRCTPTKFWNLEAKEFDSGNTVSQANKSGVDSSLLWSSLTSSFSARAPFRRRELNLDNLLTKFLFYDCGRFGEEILYTIFIGRPLLLVSSNHNYTHVKKYAQALSILVPGANNLSVQLWRNWPLTVQELTDLKIVVISKGAFNMTCKSVRHWCSYFILDEMKLCALPYKRKHSPRWISRLLRKSLCKSPRHFRRHLQTNLARMQLHSYLYYWIFVIGIVKAPRDAADSWKGPFLGIEKMLKLDRVAAQRWKDVISDETDFAILRYWAGIIQSQVSDGCRYFHSHRSGPSRENAQARQMCNISLRDRLLQQYSVTCTALLVSSERPEEIM